MKAKVKMNKPGQHSIWVLPSAVPVWERNGWTAVDDRSSETDSEHDETVTNNDGQPVDQNEE